MKTIKKSTLYLLFIAVFFSLQSCGSNTSPEDIEKSIWEQIVKKNYKKSIEISIDKGNLTEEQKKEMQSQLSALSQKAEQSYEKKGGVVSYQFEDVNIDEETGKAVLSVKYEYKDGTINGTKARYTKVDNQWKRETSSR